ncbi:hypothetical protein PG996_004938 [Apiospora saccharicola]|uniref:Uncharacterized protein n=1 Tax=Apiospora saccharicola TaxID=335842 RepID=A0ABR1VK34_9PEZI
MDEDKEFNWGFRRRRLGIPHAERPRTPGKDSVDRNYEDETCGFGPNGGTIKCVQTDYVFRNGECKGCPPTVFMCGSEKCAFNPTCWS